MVFLLKEVNGGENWDLCEFLRDGGKSQTWNNVSRWVEGIRNIEREIPWIELDEYNNERRKNNLESICVVNVKKTSGSHTSVNKQITEAADFNSINLKKQIQIYSPDIIICGGTGDVYFDYIMKYKPNWRRTSRGIWYVVEDGRIVISYLHPEARVKDCIVYYGLIDALKEILMTLK